MALTEIVRLAVAVALTGVLAFAAVSDIRFRRIPNWTVIAIVVLFGIWAIANRGAGVVSALEAAGIAFVVTVALYAVGRMIRAEVMGAGDSKLLTAVALFAGMGYLPLLAVATTLSGGAIALVSLISQPTRALVMAQMRGKGDWGRRVPYGVAIALGGAVIVWAPMAGLVQPLGGGSAVTTQDIERGLGRGPFGLR